MICIGNYIKHFEDKNNLFMLPNPGIRSSFCKISEEDKQGNGPTIIEERFQTKQL